MNVCQTCQYYHKVNNDEYDEPVDNQIGECRYNPPIVMFHKRLTGLHETTVFPKVARNQWCGKHREKAD